MKSFSTRFVNQLSRSVTASIHLVTCAFMTILTGMAIGSLLMLPIVAQPQISHAQAPREKSDSFPSVTPRDVELSDASLTCAAHTSGIVEVSLRMSVVEAGASRSAVVTTYYDLMAPPWERFVNESWTDAQVKDWFVANYDSFEFENNAPRSLETRTFEDQLNVFALTDSSSDVSINETAANFVFDCFLEQAHHVDDRLLRQDPRGRMAPNALKSFQSSDGESISEAAYKQVRNPAHQKLRDMKAWWLKLLRKTWVKWLLRISGLLQLYQVITACLDCLGVTEGECDMVDCVYNLIMAILSLTPGGRLFALLLDLLEALCEFFVETCAQLCERFGNPQILPHCPRTGAGSLQQGGALPWNRGQMGGN
jgi:hypothetical protein